MPDTFHSESSREVILITGGSGLIGQAMAKRFSQNFQVVALDIKPPKNPIAHVAFIPMNVSKDNEVKKAIEEIKEKFGNRIASVIHLAAYYSFSEKDSEQYDAITVAGTKRFLTALQELEVGQFIFSSTMLVYEPNEEGENIDESSPVNPQWAYPKSKVNAEKVISDHHGNIPYVLMRIAGVYDDHCHSIPIANQIERINERHLTSHFFPARLNQGQQSFLHMEDLVSAMWKVVEKRKELPENLTLVLGETGAMSYGELQNEIGQLVHGKKWTTQRIPKVLAKVGAWVQEKIPLAEKPFIKSWMVDLADDNYELDISKAREMLGWQPEHHLKTTLPLMVNYLKENPKAFYKENKLSDPIPAVITLRRSLPALVGGALGLVAIVALKGRRQ